MSSRGNYRITITRVISGQTVIDRYFVSIEKAIDEWEKEAQRSLETAANGGSIELQFLMRHQDGQWREPQWNMETRFTAP